MGVPKLWAMASLALAVLSTPAPRAQTLETVRIHVGAREALLPALVRPGGTFVSLKGMAAALGGSVTRGADESFRLSVGEAEIDFPSGIPALVRVGSRVLSLGADALAIGDDLFVPQTSVPRLVEALDPAEPPAPVAEGNRWLLVGSSPGELRLEADLPRPPGEVVATRRPDGDFDVLIKDTGPVELPWTRKQVGSPLIASLTLEYTPAGIELHVPSGRRLTELTADRRVSPPGVTVIARGAEQATVVPQTTASRRAVRRVVLDPGHGGAEDGAIGPSHLKEKDVVLDVARRLASLLRLEGFDVQLTRDEDIELSLDDRAAAANRWQADLFVSLHANASAYRGARGAETYFLSLEATDDEARTLAALENNAAAAAGANPDPMRGDDELPLILWDMAQREYLQESSRLAETIQRRLNDHLGLRNRGVRQAPFRVLVGATCPAVLVELGFMTHGEEEARLSDGRYREGLAEALRDAIRTFRKDAEAAVSTTLGSTIEAGR
ncbi:MAG: N-acetylmuramoyl-L-alanine amidase [Acidobacteriota bacterium]|nr:MAG: N-acetylmuramoyl-L-alanine amidase [Acidobacteriota bacterium]